MISNSFNFNLEHADDKKMLSNKFIPGTINSRRKLGTEPGALRASCQPPYFTQRRSLQYGTPALCSGFYF